MRNLTLAARQSMMQQQTDVVWLTLVTLDHEDMDEPIRVVNNTVNITSRGNVYTAFPFQLNMPQDSEDAPPTVTIQIDNVDRTIIQALRVLTSAPSVTLEIITSEDLDIVEVGPFEFELKSADYDAMVIEGTLAYEPILSEPYPSDTFTPSTFPGLF